MGGILLMLAARRLKFAAAASLSSMVAAIAIAGPLVGTASAAPPQRTQPPTITSKPASPTASTGASFAWTSPETDNFTCTIDGSKPLNCGSGTSGTYAPSTTFGAGTHTFTVRAKLAASKSKASSASATWTVDLTGPPPPQVFVDQPSFTQNVTASITWSDVENNTTFLCSLDSHLFTAAQSCDQPWSVPRLPATALSQGSHFVDVYAIDAVGNINHTPGTVSWTVDTTAPSSPTVTVTPSGPTSATITWTDGDATSFVCTLDNRAPVSCAPSGWPVTNLGEGTHIVSVQGTDTAGNVGDPGTAHWVVDTTAPPAPVIKSGPAHTTDQLQALFYFDDADSSANFACAIDDGSFSPCTSPFSYTLSSLPTSRETHTFHVRATDQALNTGPVADWTWTIDPDVQVTPPEITSGPSALTKGTAPTFAFDSLDDPSATFECAVDSGVFTTCSSPQDESVTVDGQHNFYVREISSTSGSALTSDANSWTWTLDRTPPPAPVFSSAPDAFSKQKTPLFSFTDAEANVTYVCQRDAQPSFPCVSPVSTSSLADGAHTFTVAATDPAGNSDAVTSVATHNWTVDTVAPAKPDVTGSDPSGTNATLGLSDADSDVTSYLCALNGSTGATCQDGVTFTGLAPGQNSVIVQAVDHAGNISLPQTFNWIVDGTVPSTPTVDRGPDSLTSSRNADFTFSIPDATATSLQCWLDGVHVPCTAGTPSGGTLNAVQLVDGDHTFMVVAVNSLGNTTSSAAYNWTVDATAPAAPRVTGPGALVNTTAGPFGYSDTSTDVTSYTCSLDGAAEAVCLSSYPVADGAHTLVAYGYDGAGNKSPASATYNWTADTLAPAAPAVHGPAALVNTASSGFTYSDAEAGVSYLCSVDGGVQSACQLSYTVVDGAHTLVAFAKDAAGNKSPASATYHWTVDTLAPAAPAVHGPAARVNTASSGFTYSDAEAGVS